MARKSRSTGRTPRAGRGADSRKETSAPRDAGQPVLEAVDSGGLGMDDGMILATTMLLAGAVVLAFLANNAHYG